VDRYYLSAASKSASAGIKSRRLLHFFDLMLLPEVSSCLSYGLPHSHLHFQLADRDLVGSIGAHSVDSNQLLNGRRFATGLHHCAFTLPKLSQEKFSSAKVHSCVALGDEDVQFDGALLQKLDVEVVYLVLEGELGLVDRSVAFCCRGSLGVMVEEGS